MIANGFRFPEVPYGLDTLRSLQVQGSEIWFGAHTNLHSPLGSTSNKIDILPSSTRINGFESNPNGPIYILSA
jgi:hypothetical protein